MKTIENLANKFNNDVNEIASELKRVQSIKCRLKKQRGKSTFEAEFKEVCTYEDNLKQARALLKPKNKPVTEFNEDDVAKLDYEQTQKAIRNIQSKKTNSRYLTEVAGDNDEYRNACKIEAMLKKHRDTIEPIDSRYIRKSDVVAIIETIETSGRISQKRIIEMLQELL